MGGLLVILPMTANELGTTAISATLERSGARADAIDEVFMGCVLPAGLKQCLLDKLGAGIPIQQGPSPSTRPVVVACRRRFCG